MAEDTKPPTEENPPNDPPKEPENEPPKPPSDPPKDPEKEAQEHDEKVPAWGEALIEQVSSLTDMLSAALPNPDSPEDVTPRRDPWHKRGFKK